MRCGETTDRREEERNTHALSLLSSRFPFSLPRLSLLTSSEPRERVTGTEPKRGDRHERVNGEKTGAQGLIVRPLASS